MKRVLEFHLRAVHRVGGPVPTCKWCGSCEFGSLSMYWAHLKACKEKQAALKVENY